MEQIESNQNDGVKNLSEEEIEKIKEAFEAYDNRGRGKFSPKDFKASMESSGMHEKEPLVYSIIDELDTEYAEKNGVTFDELIEAINNKLGNKQTKEGVRRIFDLFVDKKGETTITLQALKKAACAESGQIISGFFIPFSLALCIYAYIAVNIDIVPPEVVIPHESSFPLNKSKPIFIN